MSEKLLLVVGVELVEHMRDVLVLLFGGLAADQLHFLFED